ncbi:nuclear transport factor 2 family protein [uncultured Rhodoblastus sp.]|uniref:nuclear transport factor 2 family protein n=1 Tax=uncultured Rhodoblastus sp. TaxID=543037 RepID=UPI0025E33671|nr:nuclear transport factor 2 family protein [uncultured Rhodoblastus sp.]
MTDFQTRFVPEESHPQIRALVERMLALRSRPEEFIALFQPDAMMHMVGDRRDWPYFGTYRGHAQILELLHRIGREFERLSDRLLNIVIDGENFAMRRLLEVRHHGSSQLALLVLGDFVRTRGGLIDEFFQYSDTATACRLMR